MNIRDRVKELRRVPAGELRPTQTRNNAMAKREKNTPEEVAAALRATNGLVYLAADRLGVAASTIYRAAERHKEVAAALEHQKGKRLDTAEAALWKAVKAGEAWAVCFYLKTQGKARGYVERQEVDAHLRTEAVTEVVVTTRAEADRVLALNASPQ